jgi:DNA repair exonuclease SbcCD ATPase subunit
MSEHCHCTHAVQKRACQHKGFCERIKELEDANSDKSQLLASSCQDILQLQAKVEELTAETDRLQAKSEELEDFVDRVASDDSRDNYWLEDAIEALKERDYWEKHWQSALKENKS